MYKNILIPTDGSDLSAKAVEQGIALSKSVGARVTALTVTSPFHIFAIDPEVVEDTPATYTRRTADKAAHILGAVASAAKAAGVACDSVCVEHEHPYEAIIETAVANHCDLILMASHGRRGVSAVVLGSETVEVLTHSKIPVLVCR